MSSDAGKVSFHPVTELFPLIDGEAFEVFCQDIRQHGQREKILIIQGRKGEIQIADGRNRYRACIQNGMTPKFVEWNGQGSLAELVVSLNFHRRHLTPSQKAAAAVAIEEMFAVEAQERQKASLKQNRGGKHSTTEQEKGKARDHAARLCGVNAHYISDAKLIRAQDPKLFAQLITGTLTISQAKRAIHLDHKRTFLDKPLPVLPSSDSWEIRTGDFLQEARTLPRHQYRLIFADPPYNIGIDYGTGSQADRRPDYHQWCGQWMDGCLDVLTPDGSLWILINDENAAEFVIFLRHQRSLHLRAWIKWYETFGTNCSDNFNRTSRHLLYFVKNPSRFVFNHHEFVRPSARQEIYADKRANPNGKLWDDVWVIPRLVGTAAERLPDFPTQLPLAMIRPIVLGCTEPGDQVLDPFSGSGTTAEAAVLAGRKFMGIEINPQYAQWSRARIHRAVEESHAAQLLEA